SPAVALVVDHVGQCPDAVEPAPDVDAAVLAPSARVAADRDGDLAPAAHQFVGQLHTRRGSANHEHAALRQLLWIAIGRRRELFDVAVEASRERGYAGLIRPAARDHDGTAPPRLVIGADDESL